MEARLFDSVRKDATVNSVHATTALGNQPRKRKARLFKEIAAAGVEKRDLQPGADGTAKTPFLYDVNALGSLRPDQVPRFLGALTDSEKLPSKEVKLGDLHAMQDRVDPAKVEAMRTNGSGGKLPVIVQHNGKLYIADGHHRLAAAWLIGDEKANVRFKDLEPVSNALKRRVGVTVAKSDDHQNIFGWASVSMIDGKLVIDKQDDAIEIEELEKGAYGFALHSRAQGDMHETVGVGRMIESCVFTPEKAALGLCAKNDKGEQLFGWWVGFHVDDPQVWSAHKRGERPEFSIGGGGVREPI